MAKTGEMARRRDLRAKVVELDLQIEMQSPGAPDEARSHSTKSSDPGDPR
jgi:hypothetical protein